MISPHMQTRCPHCQTTFRVSQTQLDAAHGKVRCGNCQQVFNAREHISAPAETAPATPARPKSPPPAPPQIDWLQQGDKDTVEHINLGDNANADEGLATEEPDGRPDAAHLLATDETHFDAELVRQHGDFVRNTDTMDDFLADDAGDIRPTHAVHDVPADTPRPEPEAPATSEHEIDQRLPGIESAYVADNHLNAGDEQGLHDLQSELDRQLQLPEDDDLAAGWSSAYEPEPEALEDVKPRANKTSVFEKITLASAPAVGPKVESSHHVNWDQAVHHDPEVPLALRSSMQALHHKTRRNPLLTGLLSLGLILLCVLLAVQAVVFRSYDIATQWPQSHALLNQACQHLPCVYSGRREPRKIQLINRDVRAHPVAKHALLISATLVNQAGYAQPYPRLAITLSDLSGEVVAEREFLPQDYLKAGADSLKLLRPDVPILITLEVLDPGSEAVNFEFQFL
ncbi:MAG: DUF3426 domain-containing protein [Gammaproteobacteria bacterium]